MGSLNQQRPLQMVLPRGQSFAAISRSRLSSRKSSTSFLTRRKASITGSTELIRPRPPRSPSKWAPRLRPVTKRGTFPTAMGSTVRTTSKDWAKHRGFTACDYNAILRYKVSRDLLHGEEPGLHLSFPEQKELWKKTIQYFRSEGREGAGDQDLVKVLKDVAFIIGPLSKDGWWDKNKANSNWPEPLRDNWTQLCIRDKKLALTFNLALDKIAFVKAGKRHQRAMVPVC